jgi:hypothetical protein
MRLRRLKAIAVKEVLRPSTQLLNRSAVAHHRFDVSLQPRGCAGADRPGSVAQRPVS